MSTDEDGFAIGWRTRSMPTPEQIDRQVADEVRRVVSAMDNLPTAPPATRPNVVDPTPGETP